MSDICEILQGEELTEKHWNYVFWNRIDPWPSGEEKMLFLLKEWYTLISRI